MAQQPTKHKVIGLVSGGKDSCFNMMHCIANGHDIVALATLVPELGIDELDSHLYQSVGTSLVPLIAKSMRLPLFTKTINGLAVNKGAEYGSRLTGGEGSGTIGDETEDLTALLKDVIAAHPDVTALSTGAILSTYQRLRMEHVCSRLGLTSLAYMWQGHQATLVDTTLSSGLEPVLVKVAGVGLEVDDVGRKLRDVRARLAKLVSAVLVDVADEKERIYGSHVAGEGGEYETITLDGPMFHDRISLDETTMVITDPSPVAHMLIQSASLVEKAGHVPPDAEGMRKLLNLPTCEEMELDAETKELVEGGLAAAGRTSYIAVPQTTAGKVSTIPTSQHVSFAQRGRWFAAGTDGSSNSRPIGEDVTTAFQAIASELEAHSLSLPLHSQHITFLLSSMSLFAGANTAYKAFFGTSPPSRACVAVDLPKGVNVRIEVVGFDDAVAGSEQKVGGRSALHVQGVSYWAPANIGPYSQSVTVDSLLTIAGQIPLVPSTLMLLPQSSSHTSPYPLQAALALQHVRRIVAALRSPSSTGGGWRGWDQSVIGWWAQPAEQVHAEAVDVLKVIWEQHASRDRVIAGLHGGFVDLPDSRGTPVIFLQAKELPKGALVEWQFNMHTGRPSVSASQEQFVEEEDELEAVCETDMPSGLRIETCRVSRGVGSRTLIFCYDAAYVDGLTTISSLQSALAVKVYHTGSLGISALLETLAAASPQTCFTAVPVVSIHDRGGKPALVALDVNGV